VAEQILNGTSAQFGYTVPFTLVHAGKYRTEDKLRTDATKIRQLRRRKQHKTQQNKTSLDNLLTEVCCRRAQQQRLDLIRWTMTWLTGWMTSYRRETRFSRNG